MKVAGGRAFLHAPRQAHISSGRASSLVYIFSIVSSSLAQILPLAASSSLPPTLPPLQREFYRSLLARHYPVLAAGGKLAASSGERPTNSTTALKNLVMELRKCCNHPYLFEGAELAGVDEVPQHLLSDPAFLPFPALSPTNAASLWASDFLPALIPSPPPPPPLLQPGPLTPSLPSSPTVASWNCWTAWCSA